ncbi:hypothetical protein [Thermogemmatispora sp.]|uniref:hypothetical protein n=1 Tax=Thermogemmatispora sp. TaxID=1968838 RepID=UPI002ACBDF66|nr:hypothetical protein [Thermogemmatispora sp.]
MSAACRTGNQWAEAMSWAEQPAMGCRSAAAATMRGSMGQATATVTAVATSAAMMAGLLLILKIGVMTPISLFVAPLAIAIASTLLLVGLVLLLIGLSLTLSGVVSLTGLSLSLVTLTTGLTPGTPRGE